MKPTLVSHFYNEEYLMPWWLEHHKDMFDHGIMIDYASTDNSVNIIKEICPNWEIRQSRNQFFGAREIDEEIEDIDKEIYGWRICLNTTEFLLGDLSVVVTYDEQKTSMVNLGVGPSEPVTFGYGIPVMTMVDNEPEIEPKYHLPLVEQKTYGIHYKEGSFPIRRGRLLHDKNEITYPMGRHYNYTTEELVVLWYGWSPYNDKLKKRKLQIKNRMPESDKAKGLGTGHLMSEEEMYATYKNQYLPLARDLKLDLQRYNR
jgi:hypothetical protein